MANGKTKNKESGGFDLSSNDRKVYLVALLASAALLFAYFYFFGYDPVIACLNGVICAISLALFLLSRRVETLGKHRWIFGSALLILVSLLDFSRAKSTLNVNAAEDRRLIEYSIAGSNAILHVDYPAQILYDSEETSAIEVWLAPSSPYPPPIIFFESETMFLAAQPDEDSPPQWKKKLEVTPPADGGSVKILILPDQASASLRSDSALHITGDTSVEIERQPELIVESKGNALIRFWKGAIVDVGGEIIALIVAIFSGWKQIEEEKKKEEAEKEEQAKRDEQEKQKIAGARKDIEAFATQFRANILPALDRYLAAVETWGGDLRNEFAGKLTDFLQSDDFWTSLEDQDIEELQSILKKISELCEKTGAGSNAVKLLESALRQDGRSLLSLLKESPRSILAVKRILHSYPGDVKEKMPDEFRNEFSKEIMEVKDLLGFVETDHFPLKGQFQFYADVPAADARFAGWLNGHGMTHSPFLDARNPYTKIPDSDKLFIEQVSSGFVFHDIEQPVEALKFTNDWDARAAMFEYLRAMPSQSAQETFVTPLTPAMLSDFGLERPREVCLHALAEQWLWLLAGSRTLYYSLKNPQRALLGRLLCWHCGSPSAAVQSLEQIPGDPSDAARGKLFARLAEWLSGSDAKSLLPQETNTLIELRPAPTQITLLVAAPSDWWPEAGGAWPLDIRAWLAGEDNWLKSHGWAGVYFAVSDTNPQKLSDQQLIHLCKRRLGVASGGRIEALEQLFAPHPEDPADDILARKAEGSPGRMIQLGQRLLLQHAQKPSPELLQIENLINLA